MGFKNEKAVQQISKKKYLTFPIFESSGRAPTLVDPTTFWPKLSSLNKCAAILKFSVVNWNRQLSSKIHVTFQLIFPSDSVATASSRKEVWNYQQFLCWKGKVFRVWKWLAKPRTSNAAWHYLELYYCRSQAGDSIKLCTLIGSVFGNMKFNIVNVRWVIIDIFVRVWPIWVS